MDSSSLFRSGFGFFSHVSVRVVQVLHFVRLQAHNVVERLLPPSQRGRWEVLPTYGVEGVFASS